MAQTYSTTIELRFSDLDLYGHVNSVVYFTYLETARVKLFKDFFKELTDKQIFTGVGSQPAWSRDGQFIIVSSDSAVNLDSYSVNDLYRVDIADGKFDLDRLAPFKGRCGRSNQPPVKDIGQRVILLAGPIGL